MATWSNRIRGSQGRALNAEEFTEQAYLVGKIGASSSSWETFWDRFVFQNVWNITLGGTGNITRVAGGWRVGTGATAASNVLITGGATQTTPVLGGTGDAWALTFRMKVNTAVTTQTYPMQAGLANSGLSLFLRCGVIGAASSAFFVAQGDAANIVTSKAIDTLWHTHRIYRAGGMTTYEIDGAVVGSSATCFPGGPVGPRIEAVNGTDAVDRSFDIANYGLIYTRAA